MFWNQVMGNIKSLESNDSENCSNIKDTQASTRLNCSNIYSHDIVDIPISGLSHTFEIKNMDLRKNRLNISYKLKNRTKNDDSHPFRQLNLPMPESEEIEKKFIKILNSIDLPPEKARILWQYDNGKKWELICDQVLDLFHYNYSFQFFKQKAQPKDPPSFYLDKLRTFLDPKATKSAKKRRMLRDSTSTQVLRDLEISLRTNNIEWVLEFLNADNNGIDVLINYLAFRQIILRLETSEIDIRDVSSIKMSNGKNTFSKKNLLRNKLNFGEAEDDVHMCIRCLRAIMNNKEALSRVLNHKEAINAITLSLCHKHYKTKALVLELLAAVCLVKGGHELILNAFDHFKSECHESRRFETLMKYFKNPDAACTEFMGACMQFINVVVNCVDDTHFRIYLQYEFSQLGLDEFLESLRFTAGEDIKLQIGAYLDNVFDVNALVEDSCTKQEALEQVLRLEDELAIIKEKNQELERDALACQVTLEKRLAELLSENEEYKHHEKEISDELIYIKKAMLLSEEQARNRVVTLEHVIAEMENKIKNTNTPLTQSEKSISVAPLSVPETPVPPPPPLPFIKPPPLPPSLKSSKESFLPCETVPIKTKLQPKYKLPVFNWTILKPNEIRGTIFNELNDEKLYNVIDFAMFEEQFKMYQDPLLNGAIKDVENLTLYSSKRFKKTENITLLEHNRLRNMAISRRKLDLSLQVVSKAILSLDLTILPLELVEILQRMIPTEQEYKAYLNYEKEKKDINLLTEEDRFLLGFCKIPRLSTKLNIMNYMCTFAENINLITPQVTTIFVASHAVRNAKKLHKLFELILAFGNYLNSSKRGPAYGFRLQSIDALTDVKSQDKRLTLMHYIVHTVNEKFSDILGVDSELRFVENAAQICLENLNNDVNDLEKGMDLTKREFELQKELKDDERNARLKDFLNTHEDEVKELLTRYKKAQEAFIHAVEYYGESPRGLTSKVFFSSFVRLLKVYKQAEQDLESQSKLGDGDQTIPRMPFNRKQQQDAVINELKSKNNVPADKKGCLKQHEVYDGVLEDILLGLKNEPYRRADVLRRSQKSLPRISSIKTIEDVGC